MRSYTTAMCPMCNNPGSLLGATRQETPVAYPDGATWKYEGRCGVCEAMICVQYIQPRASKITWKP